MIRWLDTDQNPIEKAKKKQNKQRIRLPYLLREMAPGSEETSAPPIRVDSNGKNCLGAEMETRYGNLYRYTAKGEEEEEEEDTAPAIAMGKK